MKPVLAVLILVWPMSCLSSPVSYEVCDGGGSGCVISPDLSCATVFSAFSVLLGGGTGHTMLTCNNDPLQVGTAFAGQSSGGLFFVISVGSITPVCPAGQQYDLLTSSCIPAYANDGSCVPSIRTISPCPSGFAPRSVEAGPGDIDPYESQFDTMPVQDMLYAIGIGLFGVVGIAVGVKLS
jgi:hypothetical protein